MSIVPEILLHRVIINGIRALRTNPNTIDTLLQNLTQQDLKKFKDFFLTQSIDVSINFPRGEAPKVPALVLQLQSESESQAFLGDFIGQGHDAPDEDMLYDTSHGDGASVSSLSNLPQKLYGNIQMTRSYTDPVTNLGRAYWDPATDFTALSDGLAARGTDGVDLYVIKGKGVGQKFAVNKITNNYIDIEGVFDPQLDSSSFIDLRRTTNPLATVGEPSRIFEEDDIWLTKRGVNYEAQYQLSILAGSQQEVLHLFTIMKALFLSQRVYLEAQGLQNFVMSASDFSPRSDYSPAVVYQRAMTLKFIYTFSFVEKLEKINRIDFTINTCSLGEEVTSFSIDLQDT